MKSKYYNNYDWFIIDNIVALLTFIVNFLIYRKTTKFEPNTDTRVKVTPSLSVLNVTSKLPLPTLCAGLYWENRELYHESQTKSRSETAMLFRKQAAWTMERQLMWCRLCKLSQYY